MVDNRQNQITDELEKLERDRNFLTVDPGEPVQTPGKTVTSGVYAACLSTADLSLQQDKKKQQGHAQASSCQYMHEPCI